MVIQCQNKYRGIVACACLALLTLLSLVGVINLSVELMEPGPPSTPEEFKKQHPEYGFELYQSEVDSKTAPERFRRNAATVTLVYLLIVNCMRPLAIWKLVESLKICEVNPKEALKSVEMSLQFEAVICIVSGLGLFFAPLAFFELIFIYFGLVKFRDGLRIVVDAREAPMKPAVGNDGPMAVTSSDVYPPPSNQVSSTIQENQ